MSGAEISLSSQRGIKECLIRKTVEMQSKLFYISAKRNNIGLYITVTEKKKNDVRSNDAQKPSVPADYQEKHPSCVFMPMKAAIRCRDLLMTFLKKSFELDNSQSTKMAWKKDVPDSFVIKSDNFTESGYRYHLYLRQNSRGRVLHVSYKKNNTSSSIFIPVEGLQEVHDKLADLIAKVSLLADSSKSAESMDSFTSRTSVDDKARSQLDVDHNNGSQKAMFEEPAARHMPQQSTTVTEPPGGGSSLFVAVHLRMSLRRTHLEVHVLLGNDQKELEKWQQAWKKEESLRQLDMKSENSDQPSSKKQKYCDSDIKNEEQEQPDMPPPSLVILQGFSVDQEVAARLTSTADGGTTLCHHACREIRPCPQPPGYAGRNPQAWLFQLDDKPRLDARCFFLHLHKASSTSTLSDKTWSDEICKAFSIPDCEGSCFLSQLGFTKDNQPIQRRASAAALFARPETAGGVRAVKTMETIIDQARSVGLIRLTSGRELGTGFCVGKNQKKYVLTCHHVLKDYKKDIDSKKVCMEFGSTPIGNSPSFTLSSCVAEDEKLDYAILALEETGETPTPISCCSADFERCFQFEDSTDRYLTIVGYCNSVKAIDVAVDWLMITEHHINLVKDAVIAQWSQFDSHVSDYDKILHFTRDVIFYNAARHKHGSSGSPVFLCKPDLSVKLVALHRRGFPDFYYDNGTYSDAQKLIPIEYTVEAGTRMSAIYENLREKSVQLCQEIFDNEPQLMESDG